MALTRTPYAKHWCFTLAVEDGSSATTAQHLAPLAAEASYMIAQKERAPTTGLLHIQGYLELSRKQRMTALKKLLPRAHWELRQGTRTQARDYCRKEDTRVEEPYELGSWKEDNSKLTLEDLMKRLREGATNLQLLDEFPVLYLMYATRIAQVRLTMEKPRNPSLTPKVIVYWGKTGTGKTRKALWKMPDAYIKPNGKWWPRYSGETHVIWDDFRRHSDVPYDEVLRILDRYPHIVETKGGHVQLQATTFIITSNVEPSYWFDDTCDYAPLKRRITKIKHFTTEWKPPESGASAPDLGGVARGGEAPPA